MLFEDSELFDKERPKTMTVIQSIKMYRDIAEDIMRNGWSKPWSLMEDIISDLEDISLHESGFEIAKELEATRNANYDFTPQFIEYLDGVGFKEISIIDQNIRNWVSAHDIKPKLKVCDTFTLKKTVKPHSKLIKGSMWIVHRIDDDVAIYVLKEILSDTMESPVKHFAKYEEIENNI